MSLHISLSDVPYSIMLQCDKSTLFAGKYIRYIESTSTCTDRWYLKQNPAIPNTENCSLFKSYQMSFISKHVIHFETPSIMFTLFSLFCSYLIEVFFVQLMSSTFYLFNCFSIPIVSCSKKNSDLLLSLTRWPPLMAQLHYCLIISYTLWVLF